MDVDLFSYCQDKISNIYDKYLNVEQKEACLYGYLGHFGVLLYKC